MVALPGEDGNGIFQRVGKQIGERLFFVSGIDPVRDDPALNVEPLDYCQLPNGEGEIRCVELALLGCWWLAA